MNDCLLAKGQLMIYANSIRYYVNDSGSAVAVFLYFAAPSDYIDIAASKELSIIFDKLSVPYITGKIWTTDSMVRETKGRYVQGQRRRLAVQMED